MTTSNPMVRAILMTLPEGDYELVQGVGHVKLCKYIPAMTPELRQKSIEIVKRLNERYAEMRRLGIGDLDAPEVG